MIGTHQWKQSKNDLYTKFLQCKLFLSLAMYKTHQKQYRNIYLVVVLKEQSYFEQWKAQTNSDNPKNYNLELVVTEQSALSKVSVCIIQSKV